MSSELRDIKSLLEIPDINYYFYLAIIVAIILVVVLLWILFKYKSFSIDKKESKREMYLEQLKSIDWNNPKKSAYKVTFLGRKLVRDAYSKKLYNDLVLLVEPYKYKKETPPVDDKTIEEYNLFVDEVER
jgi:hypothetical protein